MQTQYRFHNGFCRGFIEEQNLKTKILLLLRPMQVTFDFGYSRTDFANMIFYKSIGRRIYIHSVVVK